MTDVLQQVGPARRLASESIGWLTTVGAAGQPQASPVWFVWDGASLWLRSQATAGKLRNIRVNPKVAFHLADDGHGGNILTIDGTATIGDEPPADLMESYVTNTTGPSAALCRPHPSSSWSTTRPRSGSRRRVHGPGRRPWEATLSAPPYAEGPGS